MDLIAFSGLSNCVNTQYAALSGAMHNWEEFMKCCIFVTLTLFSRSLGSYNSLRKFCLYCIKNSEYDQEIPQSHTADKPVAL